jgi:hypothetical protein
VSPYYTYTKTRLISCQSLSLILSVQSDVVKTLENSAESLEQQAAIAKDTSGFAEQLINVSNNLSNEADKLSQQNTLIPYDIWLFLLFGFIGTCYYFIA